MSEFPNIRRAHRTLAALNPSLHLALFYDPNPNPLTLTLTLTLTLALAPSLAIALTLTLTKTRTLKSPNAERTQALFYDPLHVQTAAEYAADRADERGC